MITKEERWKLKQLYAACKDKSMLSAKIQCSQEQYIIAKRILDSLNEENWFGSLSELGIGNALALREYILGSVKGEILLQLAAEEIKEVVTDDLREGIFLLRALATAEPFDRSLTTFIEAKRLFEKDFIARQEIVFRNYSIMIDEIKSASTSRDMNKQILSELDEKRRAIFLGKKEEKLALALIRDFLREYASLNKLLSALEQSMRFIEDRTFILDTEMAEIPEFDEEAASKQREVRPKGPVFFREKRKGVTYEEGQNDFNLTLD